MRKRDPKTTNAYLVGGGIASLTAAVHLYHDAGVPASQIHIIEAAPVPGGSMRRGGGKEEDDWTRGYVVLAARKLNFSYRCLYETLARVPSARHPGKSVLDDVRGGGEVTVLPETVATEKTANDCPAAHKKELDQTCAEPTAFPARLVATGSNGPEIVDVRSIGLRPEERMGLLGLILESENNVGDGEIQSHFKPEFFESKFWDVWASLYAFQPWHSAVEFRRYLLRFLHEFPHISTLEGIDHAPLNDYECIILPMERHLKELGVNFQYETQVTSVGFAPGEKICVNELHTFRWADSTSKVLQVGESDIVLITLGSMTSGVQFGSNDKPPAPLPNQEAILREPSPVWKFWMSLADPATNPHWHAFGQPQTFYSHMAKSSWLSFTVTLSGKAAGIFDHLKTWARYGDAYNGNDSLPPSGHTPHIGGNSNGPLITFRDSPWMMSIAMPHQPYFTGQPDDVCVLWGYGLYPDQEGMFVHKPMMECTGAEIFSELISYLRLPADLQQIQSDSGSIKTIPCLLPFIGSPFLTRSDGDRPSVLPKNSDNIGLLGQFVEMERDVTFTMEYSARSAQTAVYGLMGLDKQPPEVHRGDRDVQVLGQMLLTIMS